MKVVFLWILFLSSVLVLLILITVSSIILGFALIIYLCRALSALTSMLQTLDAWLLGRS